MQQNWRRARIASAASFWLNGVLLGLWFVHIPVIVEATGISHSTLGLLLLLLGSMAWIGMQVSGRLCQRFPSRSVILASVVGMSAVLPALVFASNAVELAIGLTFFGFFNGLFNVSQNVHGVSVERAYARPILSGFHAFFSIGTLTAALVGGALLAAGVDTRISLSCCAAFSIAVGLLMSRWLIRTTDSPGSQKARSRSRKYPWSPRLVLLCFLAFALLMAEGVAQDWSTVHLTSALGASASVAALAYGAFSASMATVRLLADRIVAAIGPAQYVRYGTALGAVGLIIAAFATSPPFGILGWGLFGIGLAGCVPQFLSASGNIDPAATGIYLARVSSFGYLGLLAGPSLIGVLTNWMPLQVAFFVPILACCSAAILAPLALRPKEADPQSIARLDNQ